MAHSATAETGAQRAAADQPLIDIAWTGAFGAGTTAQTAPDDAGRFAATALDQAAVVAHRGAVVEEVTRYGQAAGIEARIMSIGDVAAFVANGDDPRELISLEAQIALLDGLRPGEMNADSGTGARQAAIVDQFRKLISSKDFASITDANAIDADNDETYSKDEIPNWLKEDSDDRRTFLRNFLQRGLSKGEEMILAALTTNGDLDALFMDLPIFGDDVDAWYHADWQRDVKAFLERRNAGNIRVKVNAGAISSRGDGIRAYFTTPPTGASTSLSPKARPSAAAWPASTWPTPARACASRRSTRLRPSRTRTRIWIPTTTSLSRTISIRSSGCREP